MTDSVTHSAFAGLHVSSDLRLTIDGVAADIVSDGRRLTVRTDDAAGLLTAALAGRPRSAPVVSWRASLDHVATRLDALGLSARLEGRQGALVEIGAGCSSRPARWLLGTRHARFGRPRPLGATAGDWLRAAARRRRRSRRTENS